MASSEEDDQSMQSFHDSDMMLQSENDESFQTANNDENEEMQGLLDDGGQNENEEIQQDELTPLAANNPQSQMPAL